MRTFMDILKQEMHCDEYFTLLHRILKVNNQTDEHDVVGQILDLIEEGSELREYYDNIASYPDPFSRDEEFEEIVKLTLVYLRRGVLRQWQSGQMLTNGDETVSSSQTGATAGSPTEDDITEEVISGDISPNSSMLTETSSEVSSTDQDSSLFSYDGDEPGFDLVEYFVNDIEAEDEFLLEDDTRSDSSDVVQEVWRRMAQSMMLNKYRQTAGAA